MANGVSKAQEFALAAEANGWEVERIADGGLKTVIAKRKGESVEAQWLDNHALGPIGTHTYPGGSGPIKNAATAKRLLAVEPGNYPQPAMRKKKDPGTPRGPRKYRPMPFDPHTASDEEVIEAILGKRISWVNEFVEAEESALIPSKRNGHLKIEESKKDGMLGERILSFCDTTSGGFRACYVTSIVRVGR